MPGIYIQRWIWIEQGPAVYANELAQRGFALVAAQVDTRIKAAIVTSMYDMSAAARMMQTPEQELSIETLAADIFVSKYYLIRKFKSSIGMTPHQFCIQNRIRKSQGML
ncbi:MAG: AraC family transcriptional regulator, partial [Lachnospiraceae bacterium]|nr:AraC family transcriptional regulator [Lachnospiraceae bacterium]